MNFRTLLALVTIGAVAVISADALSACGDKFLLFGLGTRFQTAYAAIYPASILIVLPPKTVKIAAVRDGNLFAALKRAGHHPRTIQLPDDVDALLARQHFDIVLAERADAVHMNSTPTPHTQPPAVVGVVENPTAAIFDAAKRELPYVLKTPQRPIGVLGLLDDVMKVRIEAARAAGR